MGRVDLLLIGPMRGREGELVILEIWIHSGPTTTLDIGRGTFLCPDSENTELSLSSPNNNNVKDSENAQVVFAPRLYGRWMTYALTALTCSAYLVWF